MFEIILLLKFVLIELKINEYSYNWHLSIQTKISLEIINIFPVSTYNIKKRVKNKFMHREKYTKTLFLN